MNMCGFQNVTEKIDLLKVSEKLLEGKELEFVRWEGDAQDLLKGVREKLNVLGEVRSVNAIMTTLPSDKTIISFSQFVFFLYVLVNDEALDSGREKQMLEGNRKGI